MMLMDISRCVEKLVAKHQTRDPMRLAEHLGLVVTYLDLGNTKGFCTLCNRHKVLFINENLTEFARLVVCAHELGHAILHLPKGGKYLIQDHTLFHATSVCERQADQFAALLLIHEDYYFYDLVFNDIDQRTYDTLVHLKQFIF
jgi:Zn-dependent peptidase ImmA (M78 family)